MPRQRKTPATPDQERNAAFPDQEMAADSPVQEHARSAQDPSSRPPNTLKGEMVRFLFETYGGQNGIPTIRGAKALSEACEKIGTKISPSTFTNIFLASHGGMSPKVKEALAELFGRAVTGMKADWFDMRSVEEFQTRVRNAGTELQEVTLRFPRISEGRTGTYKDWLCGCYICYRYSFEINGDDSVTREALRVWYEKGEFRFRLWYVKGGEKPGAKVEYFDGFALPIGLMIMFIGVSNDRARSIFWAFDEHHMNEYRYCRFGITASCKAKDDLAPVAACTLAIKLENETEDWKWWCSEESKTIGVDALDNIIGKDFGGPSPNEKVFEGKSMLEWVVLFLENKPMDKDETKYGVADTIIRLNLERFRVRMERMRKHIVDSGMHTPFSLTWCKRTVAPPSIT